MFIEGELNPKIDFSSFEHLGIVEQLHEVFFKLLAEQFKKIWRFVTNRQDLIGGSRKKLSDVSSCLWRRLRY